MKPHFMSTDMKAPDAAETESLLEIIRINSAAINEVAWAIHRLNHKWWHDKDGNPLDRNVPELLCLMHSEISEGMEGHRKNLMDDKLPQYPMLDVELADAAIREFDTVTAGHHVIGDIIYEKCVYNAYRADHTWAEREKANGKKF